MPSPSFQNARSAPQKQPSPKIAVSSPAGYGPFSGRFRTKWLAAVGMALGRPGRASAALGISAFFLNMNIQGPPYRGPNIGIESAPRIHIAKIPVRQFITRVRGALIPVSVAPAADYARLA